MEQADSGPGPDGEAAWIPGHRTYPALGAGSPARPGGAVVTGSDGAAHGTRTPGFCETRILVRAPRSCLGRTPGSGVSAPREARGGKMVRCARRITSSGDSPAQGVSTPLLWGQGAAQAGGATCPASVSLVLCVCRTVA